MLKNNPKLSPMSKEMETLLHEVEVFVDGRLGAYTWKVLGYIAIPTLLMAVSLGGLLIKVENNTDIIRNSVLTVKDKDNLDLKISNLSEKVDNNSATVLKAIEGIKADIRLLR